MIYAVIFFVSIFLLVTNYPRNLYIYWRNTFYILFNKQSSNFLLMNKYAIRMEWLRYSVIWIRALNTIPREWNGFEITQTLPKIASAQQISKFKLVFSFVACGIISLIPIANRFMLIRAYAVYINWHEYIDGWLFADFGYFGPQEYKMQISRHLRLPHDQWARQNDLWGLV